MSAPTKRPSSSGAEEILGLYFPVLDHGFVALVDYMGTDECIERAARVSYGYGTRKKSLTRGLVRYLRRHKHTTPSEMVELKFHCCMPMFIARQWIRHRTANVNEYSGRYSILDKEFYLPDPKDLAVQSSSNRQGRGQPLTPERAATVLTLLRKDAETAYATYERLLGDEFDLARELARMDLTLNYYTQWYWKIDLHNLLHFLSLRMDAHAQYEIRVYAEALASLVKLWVPDAYEAFVDYQMESASLSRMELDALRALLRGETPDLAALGLSVREQAEFKRRFGLA